MKSRLKYILQKFLGIDRYLYWFSIFKIKTIKRDKKESGYFKFLEICDKQDGDLLDIGANIGVMSYHAVSRFPRRSTYAFEPMPINLKVLKKIKKKYDLTQRIINDFALGQESGELEMVLPKQDNVTLHGLAHVVDPKMEAYNEGDKFKVQVNTIDAWIETTEIEGIAGIKLDVENFEIEVLKGSKETVNKYRPIITTELWNNQNRLDCLRFFDENKYDCFGVVNDQLVEFKESMHDIQNFILIPREKQYLIQ